MDYPVQPIPAHVGPDPASMLLAMKRAVGQAQARWPRIANIPMAMTTGVGPGFSETYEPGDEENPRPGNWTVQLRSPEALRNRANYPSDVGLEAIHALQAQDPAYQRMTQSFVRSMTPQQMVAAHRAYLRDQQMFGTTEPFEQWLQRVQAQEYIRGGIFTDVIPGWVGPKGEGQYTPQQLQLLNQIQGYLKGAPAPAQMR